MIKHYSLPLPIMACFLLISLLLQSCGGLSNLPLELEEEGGLTETIEQEDQISIKREEQGQASNSLPPIMPELWQEIFAYLDFKGVLAARAVSTDWNKLITGFREAGVVGIENKPSSIIDTWSWVKRKKINFGDRKLKELTPATIPSFAFYYLMGKVNNLPQSFWPYLKETQVHTLSIRDTQIGDAGSIELAKALPQAQVHTLYLGDNRIRAVGASELAKTLPATRMHTLHLGRNQIGAEGAQELAKALQGTQVHTLHLGANQIGDAGASKLAKALSATQVHILNLYGNAIGDQGAIELAKSLPATRVHTLALRWNQIGEATQQLLVGQYPYIKWRF